MASSVLQHPALRMRHTQCLRLPSLLRSKDSTFVYLSSSTARRMQAFLAFRTGSCRSYCWKGRNIATYASQEGHETELQDVTDLPESTKAVAPTPSLQRQYESTNMWEYKPQWCQPWSILLTGSLIISAVNYISHKSALFTGLVALPVFVWWYLFLVLVPGEFKEYVQRQKLDR